MFVTELRDRLVVVKETFGGRRDDRAQVLAAVRRRTLPTPRGLSKWIARRFRKASLDAPLFSQFREALDCVPTSMSASISTFRRVFARHGRYTARDWRAIAQLSVHTAACASHSPMLPVRTARDYARKYLCLSYHVMAERLGWEWVLEGALRTGAYL